MAKEKAIKSQKTENLDISKALRMCVDTGSVSFGMSGAKKKALIGQGKLVVVSSNVPAIDKADLEKYCKISKIATLSVGEDSRELGSLCGKPFPVSALVVLETGDSPLLNLLNKK